MNAPVTIYNAAMEPVADLPLAYEIAFEMSTVRLGHAWFSLPFDDPHIADCTLYRYAELYDGEARVELFRIVRRFLRRSTTGPYYRFECEHVLGTLVDKELTATLQSGPHTAVTLADILAEQTVAHWQLGTCDFDRMFLYEWEPGTSLLKAITEVPSRFQDAAYLWTWDTTSYPWTLNLVAQPTTVSAYIDYGRNLKLIEKDEDCRGLYTRLIARGAGAGVDQLGLTSLAPGGLEYIDAATIGTYGVITRVWIDQRYTVAQNLYDAAVAKLAAASIPKVTYSVGAADLSRITGEATDRFTLGALVEVNDADIGVAVQVRIEEIRKGDLEGSPGETDLFLANGRHEFDYRDVVHTDDLSALHLSDVPGGMFGSFPAVPTVAGIYAASDYLGLSDGSAWRAYFDVLGRFKLVGDASHYLTFDINATPPLTIYSDGVWIGSVSISKLTAGNLAVEMNLTAGGSVKSNNYAAGSAGWKINNDGVAEFQSATVRGAITALTGSIGGWTIATGLLSAGTGGSAVGLAPGTYPFYAGSATAASAPFRVSAAGALVATSATITGAITANSGTIGGFTIGASSLTAGSGATAVGIAPATYPFYAGNATPSSAPFRVKKDGTVVMTTATVSGAITALSGSIAGWTIETGLLHAGTGASYVGLAPGTYPFFAGSSTAASAPFRVSAAGALTATNATITGAITASSGTIGGFTIGANALTAGTGATAVGLAPASYPFYAGNVTASDAPFRVSKAGVLYATGATISGTLTATSGSFTGTIIATLGSIGGWTIGTGLLSAGSGATYVGMRPADYPFFAGNSDPTSTSCKFSVSTSGAVVARALTIHAGRVGSMTIDADGLDIGTGGRIVGKHAGTDASPWGAAADWEGVWLGKDSAYKFFVGDEADEYLSFNGSGVMIRGDVSMIGGSIVLVNGSDKIWMNDTAGELRIGGSVYASAPFKVSAAGALTATGATISGAITAASGSIGGWTIGSGLLSSGAVGLRPADYPFFAGNADPTLAEFHVDANGSVTCTDIAVSGVFMISGKVAGTDATPWGAATDWRGVWLGKDGSHYKLFIGNEASAYLSWDNEELSISGVVNLDEDGLDLGADGRIVGKESGSDADPFGGTADWVGVWLGADGSTHKFFVGDEASEYLSWNGSALSIAGDVKMTSGSIVLVNGSDKIWLNDVAGELRIGGTSYSAAPFQVSAAGALKSTAGTIGGVTIGATSLTVGSGGNIAGLCVDAVDNYAFYAGNATPASAEFWVKTTGAVYASNLTIDGGYAGDIVIDSTGLNFSGGGRVVGKAAGTDDTPWGAMTDWKGVWLGKDGGSYKLFLGDEANKYLSWNGTDLTLVGTVYALAGNFGTTANCVSIEAGGLNVGAAGAIRGGQTAYNSGSGFFLGYSGAAYKFSVGNSATGKGITWDGTTFTVRGTLNASDMTTGTLDFTALSRTALTGVKRIVAAEVASLTGDTIIPTETLFGTAITAVTIQTAEEGSPAVFMSADNDYGMHIMGYDSGSMIRCFIDSDGFGIRNSSGTYLLYADLDGSGYPPLYLQQPSSSAAMPVLVLEQHDQSEGYIDFYGVTRGSIGGLESSEGSLRIEVNGVVKRIPYFANA